MEKLIVDKKFNGKKLNMFLQSELPSLTNNLFYKTLRKKDIKINGKRVNQNVNIYTGDEILLYIPDTLLNYSNLNVFFSFIT